MLPQLHIMQLYCNIVRQQTAASPGDLGTVEIYLLTGWEQQLQLAHMYNYNVELPLNALILCNELTVTTSNVFLNHCLHTTRNSGVFSRVLFPSITSSSSAWFSPSLLAASIKSSSECDRASSFYRLTRENIT